MKKKRKMLKRGFFLLDKGSPTALHKFIQPVNDYKPYIILLASLYIFFNGNIYIERALRFLR